MITIAQAKLRQIEILQKVLVAVEAGVSLCDGGEDTYLCHEICEAYSEVTQYRRDYWNHDEVTVLGPLANQIEREIAPWSSAVTFLMRGDSEDEPDNLQALVKQFRIDLVKKMLADRGVEV